TRAVPFNVSPAVEGRQVSPTVPDKKALTAVFAIFASYRGRSRRRAEYVEEVAEAFANADSVLNVEQVGVEDLLCHTEGAEETLAVVLSLIQAGDFAIGIGRTVTMAELYPEGAEGWEELAPHEQMAATGEVARR